MLFVGIRKGHGRNDRIPVALAAAEILKQEIRHAGNVLELYRWRERLGSRKGEVSPENRRMIVPKTDQKSEQNGIGTKGQLPSILKPLYSELIISNEIQFKI